jgi:hypothetical protein
MGITASAFEKVDKLVDESEELRNACAKNNLGEIKVKLVHFLNHIAEDHLTADIVDYGKKSKPFIEARHRFNEEYQTGCMDKPHLYRTCSEESEEVYQDIPAETIGSYMGNDIDGGSAGRHSAGNQ